MPTRRVKYAFCLVGIVAALLIVWDVWLSKGSSRSCQSMLLSIYPVIGIILLIVFLLGVSFQMHTYWKVDDAQ